MTDRKWYYVSADHIHPDFRFRDTEVLVGGSEQHGFFAQHPRLGCGHTCKTESEAVHNLFRSHACQQIVMVEKPQHGLTLQQLGRLMEYTIKENEASEATFTQFLGEINMDVAQHWNPYRLTEEFLHWSWGENWWGRPNIQQVLVD